MASLKESVDNADILSDMVITLNNIINKRQLKPVPEMRQKKVRRERISENTCCFVEWDGLLAWEIRELTHLPWGVDQLE
jgi:hypothetical protein